MLVLIVEDEALFAMYLEMLVVELGHEVCAVAASARDAIVCASTHHPDVALMDIRLARESSGLDAARELHARHGLRCIFLSGNLDEATRNAVLSCEPVAFVGKPIVPISVATSLSKSCPSGYSVAKLIAKHGRKGNMTEWVSDLRGDSPKRDDAGLQDRCDVVCPDLPKVL